MTTRLGALLAAVLLSACELPWVLLETGTTADDLRAAVVHDGALWAGTADGEILRVAEGDRDVGRFAVLDAAGGDIRRPVKGLVVGEAGRLYGWLDGALVRGQGGSLATVPPPVNALGRPEFDGWAPTALAARDGLVLVAHRTTETARPVGTLWEGQGGSFAKAAFETGIPAQISWVAIGTDGTHWAGNGVDGEKTLFRRVNGIWSAQVDLPMSGALRVAATGTHLFVLAEDGIHAITVATPRTEDDGMRLSGRFTALCAAPDGRVAVVGKGRLPWFPLWVLEGSRWANVNTGTREALWGVHCGDDSRLWVVGGRGIALAEPE
ncbi:MAG: hypothetical protein HY904_07260 [Deltaproteobacteria bacterium]|nr:hypothetical protein [Deltaproteobacteria bacterium]